MPRVKNMGLARVGAVGMSLVFFSGIFGFAQEEEPAPRKTKREHIQATAMGTSTQLGRIVNIDIIINGNSTVEEQKGLMAAFAEKGNEGLANALEKMHAKGRIAITGTLGYDLNYVREFPMPDGGRRIRFVTDRPIFFGEAWSSTRSMDYSLAGGEIILSRAKGKSSGVLFPACQLKLDKKNQLEIETLQFEWKLQNIRVAR